MNTLDCEPKTQTSCEILSNEPAAPNVMVLTARGSHIARDTLPGQFINIACADRRGHDPLLRRPFSVYRVNKREGDFAVLYVIRGRGTDYLKDRKPGETADVVGPLGKGFDLPAADIHLLVAGGSGAAPLSMLADHLRAKYPRADVVSLLGAQTAVGLVCETDFRLHVSRCEIATEDATRGQKGLVTDLLEKELDAVGSQSSRVYACGPHEMLKKVSEICAARDVPCQVSIETHMACGVGVCMGCAVKVKDESAPDGWTYQRCCLEGPVFDAQKVIWE